MHRNTDPASLSLSLVALGFELAAQLLCSQFLSSGFYSGRSTMPSFSLLPFPLQFSVFLSAYVEQFAVLSS
jgi:hypothetical protein